MARARVGRGPAALPGGESLSRGVERCAGSEACTARVRQRHPECAHSVWWARLIEERRAEADSSSAPTHHEESSAHPPSTRPRQC
eukprot:2336113-Rhodomonas_salina.2